VNFVSPQKTKILFSAKKFHSIKEVHVGKKIHACRPHVVFRLHIGNHQSIIKFRTKPETHVALQQVHKDELPVSHVKKRLEITAFELTLWQNLFNQNAKREAKR